MKHTTIRVPIDARDRLRTLAEEEGVSMQAVLVSALEAYRRQRFLERVNADFAELRQDERASREYDQEIAAWDATLGDGLPVEPAKARRRRPAR